MAKFKLEMYHYIAFVGWIAKILTIIFSFINTRLLLDLIGIKGYALYSIIFSLFGWLALLNFALPSSVQNLISEYKVKNENIDKILQTVSFIVICIIIFFIPILYLISIVLYKFLFYNYYDLISLLIFYINLILLFLFALTEIFNRILFAVDKGYLPNIYPTIVSILSFLFLYLLKSLNIHNVQIVITCFFLSYLIIFVIAYIQAIGFKKPTFNKNIFRKILKLSKHFLIFTILASFVLRIDYIIMAKILPSIEIAKYNLDMRIFNLILFMYGTILTALWPVSSRFFHKKDFFSIRISLKKNLIFGIIMSLFLGIIILHFKDKIFLLISGKKILNISLTTGILTLIYIIIRIWTDSFATLLQSMNEVKTLIHTVPFQAIISIIAQYFLGLKYGLNGIILGLILSFLLTVVWVLPLKFYKLTKGE